MFTKTKAGKRPAAKRRGLSFYVPLCVITTLLISTAALAAPGEWAEDRTGGVDSSGQPASGEPANGEPASGEPANGDGPESDSPLTPDGEGGEEDGQTAPAPAFEEVTPMDGPLGAVFRVFALDPANAVLKNPADFALAKAGTEDFLIDIALNIAADRSNRAFTLTLPQGFSVAPANRPLVDGAISSVSYAADAQGRDVLRVDFEDGPVIDWNTEIRVHQDLRTQVETLTPGMVYDLAAAVTAGGAPVEDAHIVLTPDTTLPRVSGIGDGGLNGAYVATASAYVGISPISLTVEPGTLPSAWALSFPCPDGWLLRAGGINAPYEMWGIHFVTCEGTTVPFEQINSVVQWEYADGAGPAALRIGSGWKTGTFTDGDGETRTYAEAFQRGGTIFLDSVELRMDNATECEVERGRIFPEPDDVVFPGAGPATFAYTALGVSASAPVRSEPITVRLRQGTYTDGLHVDLAGVNNPDRWVHQGKTLGLQGYLYGDDRSWPYPPGSAAMHSGVVVTYEYPWELSPVEFGPRISRRDDDPDWGERVGCDYTLTISAWNDGLGRIEPVRTEEIRGSDYDAPDRWTSAGLAPGEFLSRIEVRRAAMFPGQSFSFDISPSLAAKTEDIHGAPLAAAHPVVIRATVRSDQMPAPRASEVTVTLKKQVNDLNFTVSRDDGYAAIINKMAVFVCLSCS